jgi:hypothetical protein
MASESKKPPEFTVTQENGSVWVNGKHNCLGRFTPRAWEIFFNHNIPTEVMGTTKTLDVSMKPTDKRSWNSFVTLMKSHHAIDLSHIEYPGTEQESE